MFSKPILNKNKLAINSRAEKIQFGGCKQIKCMKTVCYNGYNRYNCNDGLLFSFNFISIEIIASRTNLKAQDDWLLYTLRDEMHSKFEMLFSLLKMYRWGSLLIILGIHNKSVYISQVNLFSFYGLIKRLHWTWGRNKALLKNASRAKAKSWCAK